MSSGCEVTDCIRPAIALGLCRMHYCRQRRGAPLTTPAKGGPSGYGRYGMLDDNGTTVLCHECGRRLQALGYHVRTVHDMTAREYKFAHGLPLSRSISSTGLSSRQSESSQRRVGTAGWQRLEDARDPAAASAARDPEALARGSRQIRDSAVAAANGRAGRVGRVLSCSVCGVRWCPLPGHYRRTVCGPACLRVLVTVAARRGRLAHPDRDLAIVEAILTTGTRVGDVATEHGLTPTRVRQIVAAALHDDNQSP